MASFQACPVTEIHPPTSAWVPSASCADTLGTVKIWSASCTCSTEAQQEEFCFTFCCHVVQKDPFCGLFSATLFKLLCCLWWLRCLNGPLTWRWRAAPVLKRTVIYVVEKIRVLDELHLGMSSVWMNQGCVLNSTSLDRATQKNQSWSCKCLKFFRNRTPNFPSEQIPCSQRLYHYHF